MTPVDEQTYQHLYGPVPSRRLGRSLGIDLVPLKICSYDCMYCQLGRTTHKTIERSPYVPADEILREVERKLASDASEPDYIGIAGSGEPTLNSDMGRIIAGIKGMTGIPVAVLTNGSLLWMPEVQDELMAADLVLPSLDAGDAGLYTYVNRPHRRIRFDTMVEGLASFTKRYRGRVWLEVLLLAGVTGIPGEVSKIAGLAGHIGPARVQLNTVCRPPAEELAHTVSEDELLSLSALFSGPVDIVSHPPEQARALSGSPGASREDILELLKRRPCTAADIADGLSLHVNEVLKHLDVLAKSGDVITTVVDGRVFYTADQPADDTRDF